MNTQNTTNTIERLGEEYRINEQRYFEITGLGWFAFVRGECEIREGLKIFNGVLGPFECKLEAVHSLACHVYDEKTKQGCDICVVS